MTKMTDSSIDKSDTKPVPKESEMSNEPVSDSKTRSKREVQSEEREVKQQGNKVNDRVNVQQQSDVSTKTNIENVDTTEEQNVISNKEGKKKKGCCSLSTCLIGTCSGCLILIIAIVFLVIFAGPSIAEVLDKVINPDIEVPEVKDIDLDKLKNEIDESISGNSQQIIILSEDEFNAMLKQKYRDMDIRSDLEKDTAKIFIRFVDCLPWITITITSDDEGEISTSNVKLGTIDVSDYSIDMISKYIQNDNENVSGEIDSLLFSSVIFRNDITTIESIYFLQDEIKVVVDNYNSSPDL